MINAVIIEDERSSMEYLVSILRKTHTDIQVIGWASNVDEAVLLIKNKEPDIVFLDIELNDGNGFEVLDLVNHLMSFEVIFTTGFVDYKEKAMDYFAFYYLNKPVQENEVKKVLDMYQLKRSAFNFKKYEAFKHQVEQKDHLITIYEKGEYFSIRLQNVIYFEASGNYTTIYSANEKNFILSKNLKKVEDMIESTDFQRIHRSFLINIKHVKKLTAGNTVHMSNDEEIPISVRNRKKIELLIPKR